MSHRGTETAQENAATTTAALTLDSKRLDSKNITKTDSKGYVDSKTKTDSKGYVDSKTKTDSKSYVDSKTKTDSKGYVDSKTKTDPKGYVDSKTKTDSKGSVESDGKRPMANTELKTKSDSSSKTEITTLNTEYGSKSGQQSGSKTAATKSESDSANKVTSFGKTASTTQPQSKSATSSGSKRTVQQTDSKTASIGKVGTESASKSASGKATEVKQLNLRIKTESASKPVSLVNKLDSESPVESANNEKVMTKTATKTKSTESGSKLEHKSSTDSAAQDMESGNNPETPASAATAQGGSVESVSKAQDKPPEPAAADGKPAAAGGTAESSAESGSKPKGGKSPDRKTSPNSESVVLQDDVNPHILPTKNNPLYNSTAALELLDKHPSLKMRRDGKYYLKMKDVVVEEHPKVKRNKRGDVIPTIKRDPLGTIERVVSRFCEDVLCISRAQFLPLSSQGERHVVWVGKKKANHIIRYLNGNGCYVVNRFPGDIFMKDKQVMGIILREHMLMRSNHCYWKCGVPKEDILNPKKVDEDDEEDPITYRVCRHMVKTMRLDEEGCEDKGCYNFEKSTCKHLDVFIPEVQSFCTYNALQDFSNRLDDDLKGQTFICKPAYLYKGLGFRFFRTSAQFQEFYHMTEGKETSRHDFMVQRLVDRPYLYNNKKVDIRAFLLVVVLRYRRVISFIHYGFCRVATAEFEMEEEPEEVNIEEPLTDKELENKNAEEYEKNMQMYVCTYKTGEEKRERIKRMDSATFTEEADDRSQELATVFAKEEDLLKIKEQIRHIGIRVSQSIENKVWDAFGCFQIFGLDMCPDEDMKVWLIEVNSHAMSDVDTLSQTQRKVVPAVITEALGLVVETTYKSFHHLRLRKSPTNEFEETGFLFRQNYDFIFSTLAKKRKDYVWPKPPKKPDLPFYERIGQVDEQIKSVEKRKKACLAMKIAVREEQLALKRKRNAKDDEES